MKRSAAVAGQFYYASSQRLTEQVEAYAIKDSPKEEALGIIVPHAGLIYSGPVAGAVYSSLQFPKTFVLLGPNHTGIGSRISLMDTGEWEIPTGNIPVDSRLASRIAAHSPIVSRDSKAHLFEHSLEVQLPFMNFFRKDVQIVPIAMMSASIDDCKALAEGIAAAVRECTYPVTLAASTDMSHYVSEKIARKQDQKAIDRMLAMDAEGLYETVVSERITMCGYLPATVVIHASKILGARSARLVRYATSGEVSGDYDSVVGYAGIIVR